MIVINNNFSENNFIEDEKLNDIDLNDLIISKDYNEKDIIFCFVKINRFLNLLNPKIIYL